MKLRKGKWKYKIPGDTNEILYAFLVQTYMDFAMQYIRPVHLMEMREESKRKNSGKCIQGHVAYISMRTDNSGTYLLVFPEPYKAEELKLTATKIFEL